jgi:hypothetical protein
MSKGNNRMINRVKVVYSVKRYTIRKSEIVNRRIKGRREVSDVSGISGIIRR